MATSKAVPAPVTTKPESGSRTQSDRPLVSRTSILILSAFLVGAVSSRLASPALDVPVLVAAGLGVFAYFSATHVRESKRRHAAHSARTSAISDLESRMGRHVAHVNEAGPHADARRRRNMESQYLTVVMQQATRKPR